MAKLIHCNWEVSGSIPDLTLTQGLKRNCIMTPGLFSVPWVTCLSPFPMLTVQFGGQHVASLCSMMNKVATFNRGGS